MVHISAMTGTSQFLNLFVYDVNSIVLEIVNDSVPRISTGGKSTKDIVVSHNSTHDRIGITSQSTPRYNRFP